MNYSLFHAGYNATPRTDRHQSLVVLHPSISSTTMEKTFGIQAVLNETEINGTPYVLIRWKDSGPSEDTWELLFHLPYAFVRKYLRQQQVPKKQEDQWGQQGPPGRRSSKPPSYMPTPELLAMDVPPLQAVCYGCLQDFASESALWQHERSCLGLDRLPMRCTWAPQTPSATLSLEDLMPISTSLDYLPPISTNLDDPSHITSRVELPMWSPLVPAESPSNTTQLETEKTTKPSADVQKKKSSKSRRRARKSVNFYKE